MEFRNPTLGLPHCQSMKPSATSRPLPWCNPACTNPTRIYMHECARVPLFHSCPAREISWDFFDHLQGRIIAGIHSWKTALRLGCNGIINKTAVNLIVQLGSSLIYPEFIPQKWRHFFYPSCLRNFRAQLYHPYLWSTASQECYSSGKERNGESNLQSTRLGQRVPFRASIHSPCTRTLVLVHEILTADEDPFCVSYHGGNPT